MEKKFQVPSNGQAVITDDLNLLGETAALADDRLLADFLRLTPYDGTARKAVIPYGHATSGRAPLVDVAGATGSVNVYPFRAIIGSRTFAGASVLDNWRDIRSAVVVGSTLGVLYKQVSFAANASGNPRWDLVYAAVAVEADSATVTRKVKDPTSKVIASQSVVVTKTNTVTIGVTTGTPGASPTPPAITADSGGTYYIPLAYVRVPNGFTAASTVDIKDIAVVAPVATLSPVTGASTSRIANSHNKIGGSLITTAKMQSWGANSVANYPKYWAGGASGVGCESLQFYVNLTTGSLSHANGDIIDDSRDWGRRITRWWVSLEPTGGSVGPVWSLSGGAPTGVQNGGSAAQSLIIGMGSSFVIDTNRRVLGVVGGTATTLNMANGTNFGLDVDGFGRLVLNFTGAPNCGFYVWIDFSGPFPQEAS